MRRRAPVLPAAVTWWGHVILPVEGDQTRDGEQLRQGDNGEVSASSGTSDSCTSMRPVTSQTSAHRPTALGSVPTLQPAGEGD